MINTFRTTHTFIIINSIYNTVAAILNLNCTMPAYSLAGTTADTRYNSDGSAKTTNAKHS